MQAASAALLVLSQIDRLSSAFAQSQQDEVGSAAVASGARLTSFFCRPMLISTFRSAWTSNRPRSRSSLPSCTVLAFLHSHCARSVSAERPVPRTRAVRFARPAGRAAAPQRRLTVRRWCARCACCASTCASWLCRPSRRRTSVVFVRWLRFKHDWLMSCLRGCVCEW